MQQAPFELATWLILELSPSVKSFISFFRHHFLIRLLKNNVTRAIILFDEPTIQLLMKYQVIYLIAALATALHIDSLKASLVWETKEVSIEGELGKKHVQAKYLFRNDGKTPIHIITAKSACGCTVPKLSKTFFEPGESGELIADFSPEGRSGRQEKNIFVETDDPIQSKVELKLIVLLPDPYLITPRHVYWRQGETLSTKKLKLFINLEQSVHLLALSTTPNFEAKLITVNDGKEYEIQITPKSTDAPIRSRIAIQTDLKNFNVISLNCIITEKPTQ